MENRVESHNALIGLIVEVSRLNGRLRSVFAGARKSVGLGDSELMVLNSVVEAERAPTVPQIGRSLGHPRQLIQRAANALLADGLIETLPNPDHKSAMLLRATGRGVALKREADAAAAAIAEAFSAELDLGAVRDTVDRLGAVRRQIEAQLRMRDS